MEGARRLVYVAAGLALVAAFGWVAYLAGSALAGALVKAGEGLG